MSVERVGISKKSENHIQKKSTPFLWTSFQGVGKSPPGWDFPPTSLLLRGVGFQPGGREFPPPPTLGQNRSFWLLKRFLIFQGISGDLDVNVLKHITMTFVLQIKKYFKFVL